MCRILCLFSFLTVYLGLVNSWDIAITKGDQIEFYTNTTNVNKAGGQYRELTALAYDAVHNMLLFVERQNDNASIFSYHLATKEYQPLVRKKSNENIQGITFDPVSGTLFWTDHNEKSIYSKSLKNGSKDDAYGKLLIKVKDQMPVAIAVDSCSGYIYWTNVNISNPSIERARLDGSDRKTIISKLNHDIYRPFGLAIDQQTKKLYWADDREGIHFSIESADLDAAKIESKILLKGTHHQPIALTVSKDSVYWIDKGFRKVWKLPKDANGEQEPENVVSFPDTDPVSVVANYEIKDQTAGRPECQNLRELSKTNINDTFVIPKDIGLYCLHGVKINGMEACRCAAGYSGERCEVSVCHNYCLDGNCSLKSDGTPQCSCNKGMSGARCHIDLCEGHCLNGGVCSVDDKSAPICKCANGFKGKRCEAVKATAIVPPPSKTNEPCNCPLITTAETQSRAAEDHTEPSQRSVVDNLTPKQNKEYVESTCSEDGWDSVRDPIIMVLGVLCGLFCVVCAVLVTKIMQLKKRPRIKKRIIVNKNVTPLTARPDQCEITIENCCNMNICETPCFEPRSTIRPNLLNLKSGKEEKKNLIANMEHPDDLY